VEPSEFGYYCSWLLLLGLTATKPRWRFLALIMAFTGILFSQSLSAVLCAAVLVICYVATNGVSVKVVRQVAIVVLVSLMALLTVAPLIPEAFDKFYARVEQAVTLDSRADSGRVDHLPENWMMFKEAPAFGTGMASISSADANGTDVTTFTYFLMLIERGLVGTCFFMAPWIWLGWRAIKLPKTDAFRVVCILFCALNLYTFWVSSMAYTLSYWLALAICASCILGTYLPGTDLVPRAIDLASGSSRTQDDLAASST
jgi:cell division protein FtsW (lipid II flippase)